MKRISSHLGSLTLLMASAAMLTACSGKQDQSQMMQQGQAPAIAVVTLSPEETDLQTTFPATIKGKTDIDIRPQVTGFITKVHVDEGQHVRKGQVLFTLDQVQFNAAVDQARAAVNSAQTAVNTAKMTADSKKTLREKNIISEYEYPEESGIHHGGLAQRRRGGHHPQPRGLAGKPLVGTAPDHRERELAGICILLADREGPA